MKESVDNIVSELRQKEILTQEAFAAKIGVSRQTVIAIEKGNYVPSVLLALKIAALFRKPVEEIFTISYEK
jgi:putative transcriptional regulator